MTIKQVMADLSGSYGGADCPFCGTRCDLMVQNNRIVASNSCEHVDMAVAAGGLDVAISFVNTRDQ